MEVLILGGSGLLGQALCQRFGLLGWQVTAPTRDELDVTDLTDLDESVRAFCYGHPDRVVVNCTGLTNVDQCETQPLQAELLNTVVPANLAMLCCRLGNRFFHCSTDMVFGDLGSSEFYRHHEDDVVFHDAWKPANTYGRTKALGEQHVRLCHGCTVVRLQWLYGRGRPTWVDSVVRAAQHGQRIQAVTDYLGVLSNVDDVATALAELIGHPPARGCYHLVPEGDPTSRYDLALMILDQLGQPGDIQPVTRAQLMGRPWRARRAGRSILANTQGPKLRPWQDALQEYLQHQYLVTS